MPVQAALRGDRRPAQRHDLPAHASRRAPADRHVRARAGPPPEPKVFLPTTSSTGVTTGTTRRTSPAHRRMPGSARRAPAIWRSRPRSSRIRTVLGPPTQVIAQLRDPVARAVSNWQLSTTARPRDPAARAGARGQPRRPARVGPREDLCVAVRLPRARPLRRAAGTVASRRSATASACWSWRTCSPTRGRSQPATVLLAGSSSRVPPAVARQAGQPVQGRSTPSRVGVDGSPPWVLLRKRRGARVPPRAPAAVVETAVNPARPLGGAR